MKFNKWILFLMLSSLGTNVLKSQSLMNILSDKIDVTVAADGSGDYNTIMEAVLASGGNQVIFIKKGVYTEKVEILSGKNNLTFIGEDVDSTIIQWDDYSGSKKIYSGIRSGEQGKEISTFNSHSLYIGSYDFTLMNLTIKNTSGTKGQAVALQLDKDRIKIIHCRILGNQDTFATRASARYLVKDSYIEGNVDFIFAEGATIFDSCVINSNRSNCDITAPSTKENWKFGYVFMNCLVTANPGVKGVYFARAWWNAPKTAWINCYLGEHITSAGWENPWQNVTNEECTFVEYKNYGPGSDTTKRVDWSFQLTDAQAALYNQDNIFSKETSNAISSDWNPDIYNNYYYQIIRKNTDLLYEEQYNNPYLSSITINEDTLQDFTPDKTSYLVELPYGTTNVSEIKTITQSKKAIIDTIIYPENVPGTATIKVIAGNGYVLNYSLIISVSETGVKDAEYNDKIRIVSNPVQDILQIEVSNINSNIQFNMYSLSGEKIMNKNFDSFGTKFIKQIDLNEFQNGIYIYCIISNELKISGKVIKTN